MELLRRYREGRRDPVPVLRPAIRQLGKRPAPHPFIHLYNTKAWRKLRMEALRSNPLCVKCGKLGSDIDHISPHRGDRAMFHDPGNLQVLCKECHKAKTRQERSW